MNTNTDRGAGVPIGVARGTEPGYEPEGLEHRGKVWLSIESPEQARLYRAAPALYEALRRLDTETSFHDSHSPYYTFNADDADVIRMALSLIQSLKGD